MTHSPASSEDEERHSASECPEGGSESDSSPDGPGRGLRGTRGQGSGAPGNLASSAGGLQGRSMSVPDDAHFSMMVFRIGIPDLHQTVSEPAARQQGHRARPRPTGRPLLLGLAPRPAHTCFPKSSPPPAPRATPTPSPNHLRLLPVTSPPEMPALQPRCHHLDSQAAGALRPEREPAGCAQLRPVPARHLGPRRQLPGGGAAAAGVPPVLREGGALPGGEAWGLPRGRDKARPATQLATPVFFSQPTP